MARIYPFRGMYYNGPRVGNLDAVVTQPYDRIDPALQETYYARHPHNAVRLTKEHALPEDKTVLDKYERSAAALKTWLEQEILVRDPAPALYVYFQTYSDGPVRKVRKGLTALIHLEEPGKGKIFAHEMTHDQPKLDRLQLLRATHSHFGHVFMLYSDPKKKINALMEEATHQSPFLDATDDYGTRHQVWRIFDAGRIKQIQQEVERSELVIADGHHRYATAMNFRDEYQMLHPKAALPVAVQTRMATLVNMDDEGLTIYPTHRLVSGIPFSYAPFRKQLESFFQVREYPFADAQDAIEAWTSLQEDLRMEGITRISIGCVVRDVPAFLLLMVAQPEKLEQWIPDKKSREWKRLSVNVVHKIVLEKIIGIGEKDLAAERFVTFHRDPREVLSAVQSGQGTLGFFVNPVTVGQIKDIVKHRECFPQKSTDFFPKLLTGLIMNKMEI